MYTNFLICVVLPPMQNFLFNLSRIAFASNYLTGQSSPNDSVRELLGLPERLGGLGLINPTKITSTQHKASINISAPLKDQILAQDHEYPPDCVDAHWMQSRRPKNSIMTVPRRLLLH